MNLAAHNDCTKPSERWLPSGLTRRVHEHSQEVPLSASILGKANQWGDGAWLFQLFAPGCLTKVEDCDKRGITVPRAGNNFQAMEDEFFRTMLMPGSVNHQ